MGSLAMQRSEKLFENELVRAIVPRLLGEKSAYSGHGFS